MKEKMKEITFEQAQKISFDILKYLDSYCKENNIKYFIAYGTLLGAVRHKGFIPWDDDIDIVMFRKDYDKFIEEFNSEKNLPYKCLSFEKGTFYFPYAKVVDSRTSVRAKNLRKLEENGIAVDVFPFDLVADEIDECKANEKSLYLYGKLLRYSLYNNFKEVSEKINIKYAFYLLAKLVGYRALSKIITKKYLYSKEDAKFSLSYGAFLCGDTGIYPVEWFEDFTLLEFEGISFPAPKMYDEFLKNRYGDYLKLPPENERIHHAQEAWYINN